MGDRKRIKTGDETEGNENVDFIFTTPSVRANKTKLAAASEIFKTEFKYESGEIEITDCSEKVFRMFVAILEEKDTFKSLHASRMFGLDDLFELMHLVEKYQIEKDKIKGSIRKAIVDFPIEKHSMIKIYTIAKQHESVPLFKELCEHVRMQCAKMYLRTYKSRDDVNNLFAEAIANKSDSDLEALGDLAALQKQFCRNCFELKTNCMDGRVLTEPKIGLICSFDYHEDGRSKNSGPGEIISAELSTTNSREATSNGKKSISKITLFQNNSCKIYNSPYNLQYVCK